MYPLGISNEALKSSEAPAARLIVPFAVLNNIKFEVYFLMFS